MTVTLHDDPAVAADGALTTKTGASVAALTSTLLEVPVTAAYVVSATDTVFVPAVFNVTAKVRVPVPLVNVLLEGRTAAPSVEVNCTVPV